MCQFFSIRPFGVDESKISAGDVQPTINPQADTVGRMVRRSLVIVKCKVFHQHFLFVRYTISVVIDKSAEVRRMH